jgi:hypothetical protein
MAGVFLSPFPPKYYRPDQIGRSRFSDKNDQHAGLRRMLRRAALAAIFVVI